MSTPETVSPVNPLPPVIVALFLVMAGVELIFQLGTNRLVGGPEAIGWRSSAIQTYGFNGDIMAWMLQNERYPAEHMIRFVSYVFVHGSFTHAAFACVMLLALGKFVGAVFSQWATLVLFLGSSIAGAAVLGLLSGHQSWLIGAFPGVYGLIGGFTYLMWLKLGQTGERQARAFSLIGMLLMFQLVFGVLFGTNGDWLADIAGFGFGFLMSLFLSPGGWVKIRAKIRRE